jgi:hypothetical protein
MDFLRKHYEKVLLGVVLVGLAVAVAFLPFVISSEQAKLKEMSEAVLTPRPKPLTNLDLTVPEVALKRVATPASIDFGAPNRLFNPMPWQQTADKKIIPQNKVGPNALTVTNITPLYLKLSLDRVETTIADTPKYVIGIEKQAAATAGQRGKKQTYCKLNDKNETFQLAEVKGKPEEPSQLIVILHDTGERAVIGKDKPFERVDGYKADLRYDPEKKSWPECRNAKPLTFNGEEYNVATITQNEVVLSAKSNGKKWTIKANPNATPP